MAGDEGGPWHLSIREWLDKELAAKVLANASVTQVVRDAAGSEGLIRLSDPLLHRRVMDLVRYHFTGNDMAANLKFLRAGMYGATNCCSVLSLPIGKMG